MSNILTKTMSKKLSRRTFLKASAAATTLAALGDKLLGGPVSTLVEGVAGATEEDVWMPTLCYIDHRGPHQVLVHRVNGVVVGIEGNHNFIEQTDMRGRVCPKPFGMIQKSYYPYRVKAPLKRTNPEKGIGVDPGWVEISWEEALNTVSGWLRQAKEDTQAAIARGEYANIGYGFPSGGQSRTLDGTWNEFMKSSGVVWDDTVRGGGGVGCYMCEHIFCSWIHNTGTGPVDATHCNWIMTGANFLASQIQSDTSVIPAKDGWADRKEKGMKIVRVDPVGQVSLAYADEWLPIKPLTDTALFMAMNYVLVHEDGGLYNPDGTNRLDVPFLKTLTNSPYLVGPGGHFLRHSVSKKPLVWDSVAGAAKTYDDATIGDFALEGTYTASGVEVNGLGEEFVHVDVEVKPAYQVLKEHLLFYTPEWAETICEIPSATIRRLAREFIDNAQIGATIEIEGKVLPLRPAGIATARSSNNGLNAVDAVSAMHIANMLVGALNVPGGHGTGTSAWAGKDGMAYNKMVSLEWRWPPKWFGPRELVPLSAGKHPTMHPMGHWLMANPGIAPIPKPLGYIGYRSNPIMSVQDFKVEEASLKRFPWAWHFAHIMTETNEMCDILLPDNTDLETSHIAAAKVAWGWSGLVIRQRVVEPPFNSREVGDICTEIADRAGFLVAYNTAINASLNAPYKLPDLTVKYPWEDILNRKCLSATNGAKDLEWFKENGATYSQVPKWTRFGGHLDMVAKKLRYCLPYAEYVKTEGEKLQQHLDENGVDWWDTGWYTPLPEWRDMGIFYEKPEYNFHCLTTRTIQFGWANNVEIPWNLELAEQVHGQAGVTMNADAAAALGIKHGDEVWIESEIAKTKGKANLIMAIRPDCICLTQQMGHWITPMAKDRGWPTQNEHIQAGPKWAEKVTGSKTNLAMVKVYKA